MIHNIYISHISYTYTTMYHNSDLWPFWRICPLLYIWWHSPPHPPSTGPWCLYRVYGNMRMIHNTDSICTHQYIYTLKPYINTYTQQIIRYVCIYMLYILKYTIRTILYYTHVIYILYTLYYTHITHNTHTYNIY